MIFALAVLVPVLLVSVWLFFRTSPIVEGNRRVSLFNLTVIVLGFFFCALLTLKLRFMMESGSDRAWWPVLSLLGSLILFPVVLLLGGVVRNRWLGE